MAQGAATKVKKRKKSVIKRAKQSRMRAEINRANTTRVRTIMKKLRTAIAAKDSRVGGDSASADAVRDRPRDQQRRARGEHGQPLQVAAEPGGEWPERGRESVSERPFAGLKRCAREKHPGRFCLRF